MVFIHNLESLLDGTVCVCVYVCMCLCESLCVCTHSSGLF